MLLYKFRGVTGDYGTLGIREVFNARAGIKNFCSF